MSQEPVPFEQRLPLPAARDLMQCYGHHRSQTLDYALHYCLHCRRIKSCVRKSWTHGKREQRWRTEDWWPLDVAQRAATRPARGVSRRRPVNIS
jgi:hypothetical protein